MQNPYTKQTEINKEEMVLQYAPSVKYIASRLSARLPSGFQVDDLIQAGMIGLLEAVDKFDPQKGVKFKTFADFRVRGAMLDDLRSKDWIPRSVRDNGNKLEKAYIELRSQDIDYPTDKQLAKQLELKPKELPKFLEKSRPIPMISLEDINTRGKDEDALDILETLSNPDETDPVEQLLGQESKELLIRGIDKLPENEKMVLSLYYNEDLNLKEIGAVLGLTESRVSQIRTKAIAMLRSYMKSYIEEN